MPLPGAQPEEPGTEVLPLPDGRVLILRRVAERHDLALLYPSGAGTGAVPLGSLTGAGVRLLPPAPLGAFALSHDGGTTAVWQVHGAGGAEPVRVTTVPGRCTGGVWLDRGGRLLALDRELDGRTKAVAVDLHTGGVSPLLQLTRDSDDRLLLAEPDSGLMLLRSDATGEARLGWGVLGSRHPVRFPDVLRMAGALLTPVAAQPGQILSPEASVVAFRAEVPGGARVARAVAARRAAPALAGRASQLAGPQRLLAPGRAAPAALRARRPRRLRPPSPVLRRSRAPPHAPGAGRRPERAAPPAGPSRGRRLSGPPGPPGPGPGGARARTR